MRLIWRLNNLGRRFSYFERTRVSALWEIISTLRLWEISHHLFEYMTLVFYYFFITFLYPPISRSIIFLNYFCSRPEDLVRLHEEFAMGLGWMIIYFSPSLRRTLSWRRWRMHVAIVQLDRFYRARLFLAESARIKKEEIKTRANVINTPRSDFTDSLL